MKQKIIAAISALCAALLAIGPWTLFPACTPTAEKIMKCHWCMRALIPVAVILLAVCAFELIVKDKAGLSALFIVGAVGFVMPILLTKVIIGGCAMETMACNTTAFPAVMAVSAAGVVCQLAGIFLKKA